MLRKVNEQMNRNQILDSTALKRNFCKMNSIPIQIFSNPYFEERLASLDIIYDCLVSFDEYCSELEQFNEENEYLERVNSIVAAVRADIKSKSGYNRFVNDAGFIDRKIKYPISELYSISNGGKTFISIDMRSANYNALCRYDNTIFDQSTDWKDYLSKFTGIGHLLDSKYLRQVILSECAPTRQRTCMYCLMERLLNHLVARIPQMKVFSLKEDEILIEIGGFTLKELIEAMETAPDDMMDICKAEIFDLQNIPGNYGWIKAYQNREIYDIEFKGVDSTLLPQIIKHFYDLPITEYDLAFYHNGQIARYLSPIDNPWNN